MLIGSEDSRFRNGLLLTPVYSADIFSIKARLASRSRAQANQIQSTQDKREHESLYAWHDSNSSSCLGSLCFHQSAPLSSRTAGPLIKQDV
jgi:hypothetical protein